MNLQPNTLKRVAGAVIAFSAVLVSFDALNPQQAASIAAFVPAGIAAVAAVWHPKHKQ